MAESAPIRRGVQLNGIYEIDEPLAAGGMGEIYRGHAIQGGHPVAIKLIRDDLAHDEAALALFRREADALLSIHHEAIVRYFVFSMDPTLQRPYLAMEFVEGDALAKLIRNGPLPLPKVLALKNRVASGLAAAHQKQIVHRDIAPDNIIVPGGDCAKARIIDFGIARSTRQGEATIIGTGVAGKYSYMSPEQLGLYGGDVGPASDIYSLGLVLAHACRGAAIDMRGSGSPADAIERRRTVPDLSGVYDEIRPLLEWMLQPLPGKRPPSMLDVEQWTPRRAAPRESTILQLPGRGAAPPDEGKQAGAGSGRQGAGKAAALAGGGLLLVAALGAGAYFFLQGGDRKPEAAGRVQTAAPAPPPPVQTKPTTAPLRAGAADRARAVLTRFDLGGCALAAPIEITDTRASLAGFGARAAPFEKLDRALKESVGIDPDIAFSEISDAQCPAVDFTARARETGGATGDLRLDIRGAAVRGDEPLSGSITSSAANVELIVVDDAGKAYNATSVLRGNGPQRTLSMRIRQGSNAKAQRVVLVAVASDSPIESLHKATRDTAANLFASAGREISGRQDVKVALAVADLQ